MSFTQYNPDRAESFKEFGFNREAQPIREGTDGFQYDQGLSVSQNPDYANILEDARTKIFGGKNERS